MISWGVENRLVLCRARFLWILFPMPKSIPDKLFFKIGEVCEIVGVEPYVLRFWETEFPFLAPEKSKSGHRVYKKKDVEIVLKVRELLYDRGFTIAGARKQLTARKRIPLGPERDRMLAQVQDGLREILALLERKA
jgi:DNA-binding transcriptional MerR regulator